MKKLLSKSKNIVHRSTMSSKSNSKKIILDLCGGTGAWSKPYKDAGYDVIVITLPVFDVTMNQIQGDWITFPKNDGGSLMIRLSKIRGILAAPPCTMFSFARTNAKTPRDLRKGMETVIACLEIIWSCQALKQDTNKKTTSLAWWALENPYHGLLKNFIGKTPFTFDPYEFGDGYKKRTALWGNFTYPKKLTNGLITGSTDHNHEKMVKFDKLKSKEIHPEQFGKLTRTERRAITPAGFARAFFKANQ